MSFQAHLDDVEEITGRTPQRLVDEAAERGPTTHGPLVAWLPAEHGLGRGHASTVSHVIRRGAAVELRHTTGNHRDESGTLRLSGIESA